MRTDFAYNPEENQEESVIERRGRDIENGKVDNDESIPLIPNVKNDVRRTIHQIEVWKTSQPNPGFKGAVPPSANIAAVARLYGNGIFDFHAVTADGKILRRNQSVSISVDSPQPDNPATSKPSGSGDATMSLLTWQADQHRAETERVQAFGKMAMDTTRNSGEGQLKTMAEMFRANQERDREFFASQNQSQREFFATMMQMQERQHSYAMERSREDNTRIISVLETTHAREAQANDPNRVLQLLQAGAQLYLGAGDEEEEEETPSPDNSASPWMDAFKVGVGAVKDLTEAAKFKAAVTTPMATAPTIPAPPPKQAPATKSEKRKPPLSRKEIRAILRAKAVMDAQGLDFVETVGKATQVLAGGAVIDTSEPEKGNEPDSSGAEEESGEDAGETHVDDPDAQ